MTHSEPADTTDLVVARWEASSVGRALAVAALLALGLPLVGLVLVVLADQVPDRWVVDELAVGLEQGTFPAQDYGNGVTGHQVDQFTDCLGLTIGLVDRVETNPLSAAIRSPTLGKCSVAAPAIERYLAGDGLSGSYDYYRYWHGYAVPVRPAVAVVGLGGARVLAAAALVVAIAGLVRSLARRHGALVPALLIGPWLTTTDFVDLPGSLPHAYGVVAIIASTWLIHEVVARRPSIARVAVVSAVAGASVVYFDILTTAPAGWSLAGFVAMAGAVSVAARAGLARVGAVAAISWIVGYGWMWVSKWLLAALVFGVDDVRRNITFQVENRLDGASPDRRSGILASTRVNLDMWRSQPLATLLLVVVVATVVLVVWRRRGIGHRWPDRMILMFPALLVVLWYELLRNHSQVHAWFTYRSVAVAIGIIAAALVIPMVANGRSAVGQLEHTDHEARDDQFGAECDSGDRRDHDAHGLRRVEPVE
jgi:hypothetical protein